MEDDGNTGRRLPTEEELLADRELLARVKALLEARPEAAHMPRGRQAPRDSERAVMAQRSSLKLTGLQEEVRCALLVLNRLAVTAGATLTSEGNWVYLEGFKDMDTDMEAVRLNDAFDALAYTSADRADSAGHVALSGAIDRWAAGHPARQDHDRLAVAAIAIQVELGMKKPGSTE
jgi:hypothetical protein